MKSNTKIKFTIGACITVVTGFIFLHYFLKKKESTRKERSLEKETKSVERLVAKKKGRIQAARQKKHVSHMKKMTDSAKMRYTTSPEVFGDSLAKLDTSSKSRKIKDYSPSYVEAMENTISSTSPSEKSRNQYSSESYPPAIVWKHKESPRPSLSLEKSGELRDDKMLASNAKRLPPAQLSTAERYEKTKPGESVSATKLIAAEEIPSPTEVLPIDSYCYCGQDVAISPDAAGELNENCKVELLPTIVKPVSFDPYSPEDLTQVEGASDEMSKNSMHMILKPRNHHIIVPFLPILHAITYASKHSQLLQELLQNYEYFESQFS